MTIGMHVLSIALAGALALGTAGAEQKPSTLFENVRVFDGKNGSLIGPAHVLVRGNIIEQISESSIPAEGATVIRGGGRTLMPGLIDAHWHATMTALPMQKAMTADPSYVHIVAARQAEATLMRGFTTVRDVGGPVFGLKQAIDEGVIAGPRIYPSGAMISQTGGHGDFRMRHEVPRACCTMLSQTELAGVSMIADGPDEVRRRVREQLMLGASQIKLMAGGGVTSLYDPIDVSQYSLEEFRAAVEAAENWGTYVTVHAYVPRAMRMAIEAGVRCVEHGQLVDEETAQLIAERGVWWSLQPFLDDEFANPKTGESRRKQLMVSEGTDRAYALAKKYGVKVAWGTDIMFSEALARRQGAILAKMTRWYTPAEALIMATSQNAELMALSGPRNPYPGKLGVVEEGALADLLLVDGNPLDDIQLIADPDARFLVIMKDGRIYKNIVP